MDREKILTLLRESGLLASDQPRLEPLEGGVSSDIYLIHDGEQKMVIKLALPKLKVKDDWFADTSRNQVEQDFIHYVEAFRPGAVPRILASFPEEGFFLMEFLGGSYANWKNQLMQGRCDPATAKEAAAILAEIYLRSHNDPEAAKRFDTTDNFYALRIESYLVTTGKRNPQLQAAFDEEAERLKGWREALVHGDYSPKNMLVSLDRLVLLDHEVAWYGDPVFDLAFLLNHLFLKSLLLRGKHTDALALPPAVWQAYFEKLGDNKLQEMEARACRLLLMLMLARIDGKSPVEYFVGHEPEQQFVRDFVHDMLPEGHYAFSHLYQKWKEKLET